MKWGKLRQILEVMEREARKRNAPVYRKMGCDKDAFKSLIFTILSARSRDEVTLDVCKRIFKHVSRPEELADMDYKDVERLIYPIGFYRAKARYIVDAARIIVNEFDSRVPDTIEELVRLPGVGRKTANVVLADAFGKPALGVDVHVHRIANRLGLVETRKSGETELELKKLIPEHYLSRVNKIMVAYGQTVCKPKPKCNICRIRDHCKYYKSNLKAPPDKNLMKHESDKN